MNLETGSESNSLYTADVRNLFKSIRWPRGLKITIKELDYNLQFVLYRLNFNSFDGEDQLHIAMLVKEFMEKVRGMGIPIYMSVEAGDGRVERN